MAATVLKPIPDSAPGFGVAQLLRELPQVAVGPIVVHDTTLYTDTAAVVIDLFTVFPGVTVLNLEMRQSVAWTGTGNQFTAGDSDDADRFHDTTTWLSTDLGSHASIDSNVAFTYQSSDPKTIQATITISTGTTGGQFLPVLWYTLDLVDS